MRPKLELLDYICLEQQEEGPFEVAVSAIEGQDRFDCKAVNDPNKALSKKIMSAFVDALVSQKTFTKVGV